MKQFVILAPMALNAFPLIMTAVSEKESGFYEAIFSQMFGLILAVFGMMVCHKFSGQKFVEIFPRMQKPMDWIRFFIFEAILILFGWVTSTKNFQHFIDNPSFIICAKILIFYHFLEFLGIFLFRPQQLEPDSFMIYHSWAYQVGFFIIFGEFFFENHFFHDWKIRVCDWGKIWKIILACLGLAIRFGSFWNLKNNFDHCLINNQGPEELITSGIYEYERHPSYVGFYLYNLGVNALLGNPFSFVATGLFFLRFFKKRIHLEEYLLHQKFGPKFVQFRSRVPSLFDFVPGPTFNVRKQ